MMITGSVTNRAAAGVAMYLARYRAGEDRSWRTGAGQQFTAELASVVWLVRD
jgi:hypothetical protein